MIQYLMKAIAPPCFFLPKCKGEKGFTLIEIILVIFIIGIIAVVLGPFVNQVISDYLQGRELSERERQATMTLERFVRDIRRSEKQNIDNSGNTLTLTLPNDDTIKYIISDNSLNLSINNGPERVLAQHIYSSSNFSIRSQPEGIKYTLVILTLNVNTPDGNILEFTASAVPRGK